jgi:hypothetical protein
LLVDVESRKLAMGDDRPKERWILKFHDLLHLRKPYIWRLEKTMMTIGFVNDGQEENKLSSFFKTLA